MLVNMHEIITETTKLSANCKTYYITECLHYR